MVIGIRNGEVPAQVATEAGAAARRRLDVADRAGFTAFLDEAERLGPLDVLVNNPGIVPVGPWSTRSSTPPA